VEHTIYTKENGERRVKFANGEDYCIHKDSEGREHFAVPNMKDERFGKLFINRIKDAIECIREGDGDALSINGVIGGRTESVYRFVDREIGEEMRQKCIDGFKDVVFGFSLKFGYLSSFSGAMFIGVAGRQTLGLASGVSYIFFETEEQAEAYKKELLEKANSYQERYKALKDAPNSKADIDRLLAEISGSVILDLLIAFDSDESEKWKLSVVQAIKPPALTAV
jgi:hypothetical protein